jgi:hypothetical protein
MGLLQGLIGYVRKSSKKLVQAIFGWAVQALFGTPNASEKTLLSAVVAVSAGWPLLLLGVAFPKTAALVLAFVPIPKGVPSGAVRIAWIAAAVLVPIGVGMVLARRGKIHAAGEPFWKRAARGIPITVAIGTAFLVAFVTSPLRRLIALSKRWEEEHLPLLIERKEYTSIAERVRETLFRAKLPVERAEPPWLLTAPSRVIRALGGPTLRARLPENLQFFRRRDLEVIVNPNGVTLQGAEKTAARAHGVLSEEATLTPALQTTEPAAQELEKQLKDVWKVWQQDPIPHTGSAILLARLEEISRELDKTFLPYEQWQVLYREILQMNRAIGGRPQLLEKSKEGDMEEKKLEERRLRAVSDRPLRDLSSADLFTDTTREIGELIRKEIELAKAELRADLKQEFAMARSFGIAALAALVFVNMLFVALALWLSLFLAPWIAALVVAGVLLLLAGGFAGFGWTRRVRPLEATRKTLKENWQWAKSRIA